MNSVIAPIGVASFLENLFAIMTESFHEHYMDITTPCAVLLHAQCNGVHLATRHGTFADLTPHDLAAFDLIVGADICFWEELVDPLYQLVRHGVTVGVAEILIADPGRPPFDELCAQCLHQGAAEVLTWAMTT